MSERYITIKAKFENEEAAKSGTKELKKSLKKNDSELTKALHSINPIADFDIYKQFEINVDNVKRKKEVLTISSYSGRVDPPVWFVGSLSQLGSLKTYVREQGDEGGSNYYFLKDKRVAKKTYDGEKKKKPLSEKDIEINKGLFLPEGRALVKATLESHWTAGDLYESIYMEFKTEDGQRFYHKGTGQLTDMVREGKPKKCEFTGSFERGTLNGEYVSFAKRPSKITLDPNKPVPEGKKLCHCGSGKRLENCHGLR